MVGGDIAYDLTSAAAAKYWALAEYMTRHGAHADHARVLAEAAEDRFPGGGSVAERWNETVMDSIIHGRTDSPAQPGYMWQGAGR